MNYILFIFIFTQTPASMDNQILQDSSYEQGLKDGKASAEKKFYAGYCLGGCLVGAGGGFFGALVGNQLSYGSNNRESRIISATTTGSFVGGLLLYRKPKIDSILKKDITQDSLYIQGFIDGYKKVAEPRMTVGSIGGWIIGSALTLIIAYLVFCIPYGLQ